MNEIREGAIYDSFRDFKHELRQFCKRSHTNFITAKSEKNNTQNGDSSHPYKMKFFKCVKHGSDNCDASIRLCLKSAGPHKNKYMITRLRLKHTHDSRSSLKSLHHSSENDWNTTCMSNSSSSIESIESCKERMINSNIRVIPSLMPQLAEFYRLPYLNEELTESDRHLLMFPFDSNNMNNPMNILAEVCSRTLLQL